MTTQKLRLYHPHQTQLTAHEMMSKVRFMVGVWGRQSGKSTFALNHVLKCAWENRMHSYWFISPTIGQAKRMFRRTIRALGGPYAPCFMFKPNWTERRLVLLSGSEITFVSGQTYDNLRGEPLNGVVIDEVRDQPPELWPLVIRPMLTTTHGWAIFISTPRGFDTFYDFFERSQVDKDWGNIQTPSTANPLFTKQEYARCQSEMSEAEFDQEINANFRDLQKGKAYVSFSKENIRDDGVIGDLEHGFYSKHLPIVVAPDFNLSPMSWGLGQFRKGLDVWHWTDEIRLEGSHTQEAAQVLVDKLRPFENEIWVCGDATSKAGQRAAAGQSDYDILIRALKDAGRKVYNHTPDSNPMVRDRVNTMNAFFQNARGERKQFIHSRCKWMVRDFQRVLWKDGGYVLDEGEKKDLTHSSDGPGYAVQTFTPLKGVSEVGKPVVLSRTS